MNEQDQLKFGPPPENSVWLDDMNKWPLVQELDIFTYLVERKACDLREMKAYKSTLAYNYFLSECVDVVFVSEFNGKVYLKSKVRPSQSVNNLYNCWILAEMNGMVITGGCICKAGNSAVCSHIAAVLYKVNYARSRGLCGENCTDIQQKWNSGTSRNVLPSTLSSTNLKRPKKNMDLDLFLKPKEFMPLPPIKKLKSMSEFQQHCDSSVLNAILRIPGTVFNSTLVSTMTTATVELNCENNPNSIGAAYGGLHGAHDQDVDSFQLTTVLSCAPCRELFQDMIAGDASTYRQLALVTINQACDSNQESVDIWKISRKLRITSSSASKVPKKLTTDPIRFMNNHVFGRFSGNADTIRGQYGEKDARKWYESKTGKRILKIGTIIMENEPWLSASPDGLIDTDSIIEIKCPDPLKFDRYLGQKSYDIYKTPEGKYDLRKNKSYYLQVQLCLFCTRRSKCIMLIYFGNIKQPIVFDVEYDRDFVASNLRTLRAFYFKHLLPFLVDKISTLALRIPVAYKKIFCS